MQSRSKGVKQFGHPERDRPFSQVIEIARLREQIRNVFPLLFRSAVFHPQQLGKHKIFGSHDPGLEVFESDSGSSRKLFLPEGLFFLTYEIDFDNGWEMLGEMLKSGN